MVADYVPEGAERKVKLIKEAGCETSCLADDVSLTQQVATMVNKAIETYCPTVHSITAGLSRTSDVRIRNRVSASHACSNRSSYLIRIYNSPERCK